MGVRIHAKTGAPSGAHRAADAAHEPQPGLPQHGKLDEIELAPPPPAREAQAAGASAEPPPPGGRPVPPWLRAPAERALRTDLSHVRLHDGPQSYQMGLALSARAFTVGQHVHFGPGGFHPEQTESRRVLYHELAHTVQQRHTGTELVQRKPLTLDLRTLGGHFDPLDCALLVKVENTDLQGPLDAPPGKFTEVWAEYCVPKPRENWDGGPVIDGPFSKSSSIRMTRFAEIELDSGVVIQFRIRGYQHTKDDFKTLPQTIAELERLLEAEGTSHFELDIQAKLPGDKTHSVSIIGSFEQLKLSKDVPGLHKLMRNVGCAEWAQVAIPNPTQYFNILKRLLALDPSLNRYAVSNRQPPPSKQFDNEADARTAQAALSGDMLAGSVITQDKAGKYHLYSLFPTDLFWMSELARQGYGKVATAPRYEFTGEKFVRLRTRGQTYDKPGDFADAYYLDIVAASRGQGAPKDALVYETGDGFYGRYGLKRQDALDWWKVLDKTKVEDLNQKVVKHWRGHDLGKLHGLYVFGVARQNMVDRGYLEARDRFVAQKSTLSADGVTQDGKDYPPLVWWVLKESGHADNFRYLEGELDRPTEAGGGTLLAHLGDMEIGSYASNVVDDQARKEALVLVRGFKGLADQLGASEEHLKKIVISFPRQSADTQKLIVQAMGVEEGDQANTVAVLAKTASMLDIYQGLEVGGVSLNRLMRSLSKTRTDLAQLESGLKDGSIQAYRFDGDFGDIVRERAYRALGFSHLKGNDYPHRGPRGWLPGDLDHADSVNLLERVFGNYVAAQATANTVFKILTVAVVVALTALLIWATGGAAVFLAEAFFSGSVAAEILIGALLFTGISEGLAQLMGQGVLSSDKSDLGLKDLGWSFALNVVTFGVFRGLNTLLKGWSVAARLGVVGTAFITTSILSHMLTHDGKLPKGAEWGWLLYESVLMFVLLEAGGYFGRDAFRKMQIAGRNVRAGTLQSSLDAIRLDADLLRLDYNKTFENTGATRAEKLALSDRYISLLERQQKLLKELGGLKDVDVSTNVARELALVDGHLQAAKDAAFLLRSGLRQLGAQPDVFTYSAGKEGVSAIQNRFGADNVKGPDSDGVLTVTQGGKQFLMLPERAGAGSQPELKALQARPGMRVVAEGVLAVEPRALEPIKAEIEKKGGTVREVRKGHLAASVGGESFVLVSEGVAQIVPLAREAAKTQPGAGEFILTQSMRSDLAREGLAARMREWTRLGENGMLKAAETVEKAAIEAGRSLNDVMEGEALAARSQATGEKFAAPDPSRTKNVEAGDAHIKALQEEIAFVQGLEKAGLAKPEVRTALEAKLEAAKAARGKLVLNEAGVVGSDTLRTYQPGPEAKPLLEARYGAGNVTGPDAQGVITVQSGGKTLTFLPAPEAAAVGALVTELAGVGPVRVLAPGVVAVEQPNLRGMEGRVTGKGGTWQKYNDTLAVATLNGQTVVVVGEGALRLVPLAQAVEAVGAGKGLEALRAGLRSDLAREGLAEWLKANQAGRTDADVLAELEKVETAEAGKKRGAQSLHAYFEAAALAAREARARDQLIALLKAKKFGADPWAKKMIAEKNVGEIMGVLAELRVHQMKEAEVAANPDLQGKKVQVIDKLWVLSLIDAGKTRAQWKAENPAPERSAFPDKASHEEALKKWNEKLGSVKDLPGGGVAEQVKDVDHAVVEETAGGKLKVLQTTETKYENVSGQETQATEARDALVEAIVNKKARGRTAVIGRAEGNEVKEIMSDRFEIDPAKPPKSEVAHPDLDAKQLAKDIIANPDLIKP